MKLILLTIMALLAFSGCSKNSNAFDFFKMDDNYERAIDNLQTGTIVSSFETKAILSTIYLNHVYPEKYNDGEYFFVYIYLKEPKKMFKPKELLETGLNLKLNGILAVKIKELPRENKFSSLVSIKSKWNKYYMVAFLHDESNRLNLVLENDPSFSAVLKYQKAEQ